PGSLNSWESTSRWRTPISPASLCASSRSRRGYDADMAVTAMAREPRRSAATFSSSVLSAPPPKPTTTESRPSMVRRRSSYRCSIVEAAPCGMIVLRLPRDDRGSAGDEGRGGDELETVAWQEGEVEPGRGCEVAAKIEGEVHQAEQVHGDQAGAHRDEEPRI